MARIIQSVQLQPWADQDGIQIVAEAREFSLLQNVQIGSGAHTSSYQWALGFFLGVSRQGRPLTSIQCSG
jgi:hypothetical protein